MGEPINSLKDFSKDLSESLNQLERSIAVQPRSSAINEIINLGSSLNEIFISKADEAPTVDPATLYDSVSTINKLSKTAIVTYEVSASFTDISLEETQNQINELKKIQMETNGVMDSIGKLITPENANERLLSYLEGFAELSVIIPTLKDLCCEINKLNLSKTEVEIKNDFFIEKNNRLINFIKEKLESLVARIKPVIGSLIDKLIDAFNKFKEHPWVQEVIKKFTEIINTIKLHMIKSHFSFVGEVVKLAKKYNWNFQSITVQLPDIGLGSVELFGTKIPFPNATAPIVSVTFVP